ncbi:MAG TPA: hypothetical protein VG101_13010 [Puia sp.]|jgi:hypothetical protein|nr:hypothetical protein [Puia sp.]
MKRLIVLFALFGAFTSYSQVYKFRCFQTYGDKTKGERPIMESDYTNVDFLVVVNLDKLRINTYAEKPFQFDIVKTFEPTKNKSDDDVLSYKAIDNDGDECKLTVVIFKNQEGKHTATLIISYSTFDVHFRLKKND